MKPEGVFSALPTPFTAAGGPDLVSTGSRRCEIGCMDDSERARVLETVVRHVDEGARGGRRRWRGHVDGRYLVHLPVLAPSTRSFTVMGTILGSTPTTFAHPQIATGTSGMHQAQIGITWTTSCTSAATPTATPMKAKSAGLAPYSGPKCCFQLLPSSVRSTWKVEPNFSKNSTASSPSIPRSCRSRESSGTSSTFIPLSSAVNAMMRSSRFVITSDLCMGLRREANPPIPATTAYLPGTSPPQLNRLVFRKAGRIL